MLPFLGIGGHTLITYATQRDPFRTNSDTKTAWFCANLQTG